MQWLILITSFLGKCDFINDHKCTLFANTVPWEQRTVCDKHDRMLELLIEYVGQAAASVLAVTGVHGEVLWPSGCVEQGLPHKP